MHNLKQSNESVQSKQSISAKQSAGSGKNHYDTTLLVVIWILVAVGLVLMYSTSSYNGLTKFHDRFYYLKKQGFATILGLVGMFVTAGIDYHKWSRFAPAAYVSALALSVAVLFVGKEYNGSKRWLSLGPFSFQPSEFAKVAVILFLAWMIERQTKKIGKFSTMI